MKTKTLFYSVIVSAFCLLPSTFGQGVLTPPGAPAAGMKSLAQIEPRTPISAAPFTISAGGSYYLTTNLTVSAGDAITIAADNVTLDLNGFTIRSTAASATGTGILLNGGLRNLTLANGFIQGGVTNNGSGVYSGGGFANGIYFSGNAPLNVLASRLSISGCSVYGIYLLNGNSTVVEACAVRTVGGYGIVASTIKSCAAMDCGNTAIYGDEVSDSRGQCSGSSSGLYAITAQNCNGYSGSGSCLVATTAQNCYGQSTSGDGLDTTTAQNCYGQSTSSYGLSIGGNALNCYGVSTSGYGLYAIAAQNCSGYSSGNGDGIYTTTAQNCYGYSGGTGIGLFASKTASGCYGYCLSGTGLSAFIANSCSGTSLNVTHNLNSY